MRKRSVNSPSLALGVTSIARGAGLVLALYALPAGLIVACSKENKEAPAPAPTIVTDPSPKVAPSTSGSELMWASSASVSAMANVKLFTCGPDGMPKCPLQHWMEKELKPAMKGTDTAKVADLFDKLATFAPAKYGDWSRIATETAAEVRAKKDLGPAKKSCKGCHDQYKKQWKIEDRDHAI